MALTLVRLCQCVNVTHWTSDITLELAGKRRGLTKLRDLLEARGRVQLIFWHTQDMRDADVFVDLSPAQGRTPTLDSAFCPLRGCCGTQTRRERRRDDTSVGERHIDELVIATNGLSERQALTRRSPATRGSILLDASS